MIIACLKADIAISAGWKRSRRATGSFVVCEGKSLCGITGFTRRKFEAGNSRIRDAVASLIHRGPDQQGVYQTSLAALGAARLKIIDLESGNQPIVAEDGDTVIAFNGEIYNHAELRKELEGLGHRFRSLTDTETVLEAFREWDTECFARLRGMFAIALWTESSHRLVLARDRLGIKPLYIYRLNGDILFGSELKSILIHPEVERRLSLAGLNCFLSLNYIPSPWTLIDGVEKLPPGHLLEWRDGKASTERFWRLHFDEQLRWTIETAKEQLDFLLRESMREHMISDVPLGIWLSGGIDSSTILHYAAAATSSRLKTFSITFRGRSFDESEYVRQVATHYGTDHHEFDLDPDRDLAASIEEFAYFSDEPSADSGALPVWFLSKMSRQQVTVALSGEGGDELLGGYLTYTADRWAGLARRVPRFARQATLRLAQHLPVSDEKISLEYKLKRFLEGSLLPPDRAHLYWNGTFSEAEKESLFSGADPKYLNDVLGTLPTCSNSVGIPNRFLWLDQLCYLPDDILYKTDRMSMAHSLEVRPPFLDHRIVEFCASLPAGLKIRGSRRKYLLEELMKGKLPPGILRRKKVGLDIPAHDWLRGPLRELLADTLSVDAIERTKLFRPEVVQGFVGRHLERRGNFGFHLWGLMILFLWLNKWHILTAPRSELQQESLEKVVTFT
ncbi:MAG TPA: asparagine synthase (glutamine-hydrolyzing) [Terriglobia bacterium]|nr:asparagine synthase (glutamine-hydrolyzing) [Terriglobia bacterium]